MIPTNDEDNNIIPETIYADICHLYENTDINEEEIEVERKFITSPADVEAHRKVELQDADVSEEHRNNLKNYVKNIMIYSPKILVTWKDSFSHYGY